MLLYFTMKNQTIPAHALEAIETLYAIVRGCDEALASSLEAWERKEFNQAREEALAKIDSRKASLELAFS
jgi:hypothetical protein